MMKVRRFRKLGFAGLVALVIIYALFPFYWAVTSSLKPAAELFATPVAYVPGHTNWSQVQLQAYERVFTARPFARNLANSAVVSLGAVMLALLVGALAGYALGRIRFMGRGIVLYSVLGMTMFPQIAILGALFHMVRAAGMFNTWWGLILTYLTFTLPFTVWTLTQFLRSLPASLEEAAFVDGASALGTFLHVLLPLVLPAVATTAILAFIAAWNEFLFALTFTVDDSARTVPPAIAFFSGASQHEVPWGEIMAASVIVTLPVVVVVFLFQRWIVEGLTRGAVKG